MGLSFDAARRVMANHKNYDICKRPLVVRDLWYTDLVSSQFPVDREDLDSTIDHLGKGMACLFLAFRFGLLKRGVD